jgi:hypothetical protein
MSRRKTPPAAKKAAPNTPNKAAAPRAPRPPLAPTPDEPPADVLELPEAYVDELRAERDRTLREVYALDSAGLYALAKITETIEQHEAAVSEYAAAIDRARVQAEQAAAAAADASR